MTETEIIKQLKGQFVEKKALAHKLSLVTAEEKKELDEMLDHLLYSGVVGIHGNSYYLIKEQGIKLCKVTLKKRNFVVMEIVPTGEEIKISGEESDGLLVGDYLYVKQVQGLYHGIDYLKPVDSFRGKYSLDELGRESLILDYLNDCGKDIVISKKDEGLDPRQGDLVECKILSYSGHVFTVKLTKILVRASDVGSDIKMIITEKDATIDFSEATISEAKAIPQELTANDINNREDYRTECVVTIDGNDSKDFDDAVSIKRVLNGYEVKVHIADVTHYVKPNTNLDNEAVNRGTSIYVADRVVPMLPFELSNGICSLNPDVDRLALTVIMQLDGMGNVFSSNVVRSVIRSHGRLTYEKVNNFFENGECEYSDQIKDSLVLLLECATKIRRRRSLQGALKLSSTELKFKLDESGTPLEVKKQEQGKAEMMIEDLMIIANCEVAKLLKKHNIPVLYRVHEFPPLDKLSNFKDFIKKTSPKSLAVFPRDKDITGARLNAFLDTIQDESLRNVISYMMLRAMSKARYSREELGHFGLAEPYYCHFTSPIRRYPDDIVHRLVKDYLIDKKPYNPESLNKYLDKMGEHTSICEARATEIERDVDDLESAKYMLNHIGETFKGKVTGFVKRGMFVETELGIEGFLAYHCMHGDVFYFDEKAYAAVGKHHPELSFGLSTEIEVAVLSANVESREVDFATPVFYKINAMNLSAEAREDLALNGIRVSDDEESDFKPMTRKMGDDFKRGRYDDRRREEYKDHDVRKPDNDMPWARAEDNDDDEEFSGTGYTGKKKEKPSKKFGGKKDFGNKKPRFEKKKVEFSDHQGYKNYVRENRRRNDNDSRDRKPREFNKDSRRSFHRDGDYSKSRSYSRDDKKRSFSSRKEGGYSKDRRSSYGRKEGGFNKDSSRFGRKDSKRSYGGKSSYSRDRKPSSGYNRSRSKRNDH